MMPMRSTTRLLFACLLASLVAGCGDKRDKYDVYMEGLQIEAAAEKGPCKLHYSEGAQAPVLSGDQVMECLRRTEDAIERYEDAASLGMDDPDFQRVYKRAQERKQRLDGMLSTVRSMERGQL
jgi:hypothetical protein